MCTISQGSQSQIHLKLIVSHKPIIECQHFNSNTSDQVSHHPASSLVDQKLTIRFNHRHTKDSEKTMASGLFFDPRKLLVVTPLVTSTAAFWFAVDQCVFLRLFQEPIHIEKSKPILPTYFDKFLPKALAMLFCLNGISAGTAIANLLTRERGVADRWYWSGLFFSIAHFAFVPAVAWKIKAIVEDTKGESTAILSKWLKVHYLRMWTVDILALGSFLAAALTTLKL